MNYYETLYDPWFPCGCSCESTIVGPTCACGSGANASCRGPLPAIQYKGGSISRGVVIVGPAHFNLKSQCGC